MKTRRYTFPLIVLIFLGALTGCATKPSYGPQAFQSQPMTAIVVAYEPEMLGVVEAINEDPDAMITEEFRIKGVYYKLGTYRGEPVIVFATGMSIANAAMTTQMALDYFPIKEVIYMGIAGAVNPELHPGDVVVPERWYYHDESVYVNPDPEKKGSFIVPDYYQSFLDELPERRKLDPNTPKYRSFGMIHPDEVLVIKDGMEHPESISYFSATPRLLEAAQAAMDGIPPQEVEAGRNAQFFVGGNGVTGSVFLDNRKYRQWTRRVFNAEVTEMESAAIGQVCYINEVDWVIIRAVSDLAGGQEGKNEENVYDIKASQVGATVLFALLDELLED